MKSLLEEFQSEGLLPERVVVTADTVVPAVNPQMPQDLSYVKHVAKGMTQPPPPDETEPKPEEVSQEQSEPNDPLSVEKVMQAAASAVGSAEAALDFVIEMTSKGKVESSDGRQKQMQSVYEACKQLNASITALVKNEMSPVQTQGQPQPSQQLPGVQTQASNQQMQAPVTAATPTPTMSAPVREGRRLGYPNRYSSAR